MIFPGELVAVYETIGVPPLLAGAVNVTVAVVSPVEVAVPIVGAPGTEYDTPVLGLVVLELVVEEPALLNPINSTPYQTN